MCFCRDSWTCLGTEFMDGSWASASPRRTRSENCTSTGIVLHTLLVAFGVSALIVGLQPLLTAMWLSARGSSQAATSRQWIGLALGLAGLVLVVWRKLGLGEATLALVAPSAPRSTKLISFTSAGRNPRLSPSGWRKRRSTH